jgi:hypothetical protein
LSKVQVDTIDTRSGTSTMQIGSTNTSTINLGVSGDTINIPSGVTIANAGTATGFGEDNAPYFLANGNGTQTIADATMVTLAYNQLIDSLDSASGYNTSTYRYTVQSGGAGLWYFSAGVYYGQITNGTQYDIAFYRNGTNYAQTRAVAGGAHMANPQAQFIYKMAVSDYVEVKVYQNTGSDRTATLSDRSSFFGGFRIKAL